MWFMVDLQLVAVEALHLLPAASRHADQALICVGLSGVGKAASSSKRSMVDEQRRLAWM